jgi:hypothetical protein
LSIAAEYGGKGQVSTRTDSFAFGIMVIELITGLNPVAVRDIVDDAMSDEAAELIREHHDNAVAKARAAGKDCEFVWPVGPLEIMCRIAAKCTVLQQKRRTTVEKVLPELERLVAGLDQA